MKTKNKMSAKILSLLLSLMLMVGMTQVVLAAEDMGYDDDTSTSDESESEIKGVSVSLGDPSFAQKLGYKLGDTVEYSDLLAALKNEETTISLNYSGDEFGWESGYQYVSFEAGNGIYEEMGSFIPCEITCGEIYEDEYGYYDLRLYCDFSSYTVEGFARLDFAEFGVSFYESSEMGVSIDRQIGEKLSKEEFIDFVNKNYSIEVSFESGDFWTDGTLTENSITNGEESIPCEFTYSEILKDGAGEYYVPVGYIKAEFVCNGTQINQEFSFNLENARPFKSIELIKLPNKVFTKPLYVNSIDELQGCTEEEIKERTVSANMAGAQIKVTLNDGKEVICTFGEGNKSWHRFNAYYYTFPELICGIEVADLGNYKAEIGAYAGASFVEPVVFTANNGDVKTLTDSATGISVSGNLDDGTQLVVKNAEVEGAKAAFDITLVKDGKEVQPNGTITVSIPYSQGGFKVVWVKDDKTQQDMNATYENGKYAFVSNHLSTYAIVAGAETDNTKPSAPSVIDGTKPNSSTSDTATKDSAKGNSDNGAVATGNPISCVTLLVMLLSATAVMFFVYRRRLGK